jgi:hypothetical protein
VKVFVRDWPRRCGADAHALRHGTNACGFRMPSLLAERASDLAPL